MNILEYTKLFHRMEIQEKLFELKTSDNIYFWDIVRYDIFQLIFRSIQGVKNTRNTTPCKRKLSSRVFDAVLFCINDIKYMHRNRMKKYVFFKCSRNVIDGRNVDIVSDDYLRIIGNDCFLVETFENFKDCRSYNNYGLALYKRIYAILHKNPERYNVDSIIKNTFGVNIQFDEFIKARVNSFKAEKNYYRKLIGRLKPRAIFFVQNGIQKALILTCKEMKIPVIELQHGLINYCHAAYSYPDEINQYNDNQVIVPDTFFAFSDYWIKNMNYPVRNLVAMGNSHYGTFDYSVNSVRDEITFISANVYQEKIEEYLDYLLLRNPEAKINLKLHPNQREDQQRICQKYESHKNVKVYCTEVTVKELFKRSCEVIILTSTAAYEAIQYGCKLGIIKDEMSYDIEDLFAHPNTRILEKPADIMNENKHEPVNTVFFENFKSDVFEKFLSDMGKKV